MSNVPKWPPDGSGAQGDRTAKDERDQTAVLTRPSGESVSGEVAAPSDAPTLIDITPSITGAGITPADAPTMLDAGAIRPPRQTAVDYHQVSAPALPPGTILGQRYEIVALLGEGGMGAVYEALDRELDRPVALKVIRPELAKNKAIIDRFKQELLLAREVTHRNVIRIYDLGEADGIKFITMEFVQGEDLRSMLLRERKLAPEQAVDIIQQICRALEAAHNTGIIHRDLSDAYAIAAHVRTAAPVSNLDLVGSTSTGTIKAVVISATNVPSGVCKTGVLDATPSTLAAGSSGWQNLGNGMYQYNWKPAAPVGSCIQFSINLGDGVQHSAYFQITK
jgi:hypothetical protein